MPNLALPEWRWFAAHGRKMYRVVCVLFWPQLLLILFFDDQYKYSWWRTNEYSDELTINHLRIVRVTIIVLFEKNNAENDWLYDLTFWIWVFIGFLVFEKYCVCVCIYMSSDIIPVV